LGHLAMGPLRTAGGRGRARTARWRAIRIDCDARFPTLEQPRPVARMLRMGLSMRLRPIVPLLSLAALVVACGPANTISLLHAHGAPITMTPSEAVPLEIVTRSTGVKDPLEVQGAAVSYGDVETTIGTAVSSAAAPWAEKHRDKRPEGWQLLVEVIESTATYSGGRLITTLGVRLTLNTRMDHRYLAQSQASCRNASLVPEPATDGAPVLYGCMARMGRDIASWLASIDP